MLYLGRKKIWEIESDLHCSIIGTCLSVAEVKNFYSKTITKKWSDYSFHVATVRSASSKNPISLKMQKQLDKKYYAYIARHQRLKGENERFELFKSSIEKGDVAGHYWALLSSGVISTKIMTEAFGEIHMLSHLNGRTRQHNEAVLQKKDIMLYSLKTKQKEYKKTIKELKNSLQQTKMEKDLVHSDLEKLKKEYAQTCIPGSSMDNKPFRASAANEQEKYKKALTIQKKLYQEIDRLKELNTLLKKELYISNSFMLIGKNCEECSVTSAMRNNKISIQEAADLCGKCILYVGGQHSLVHHYREVVEKKGGDFIHHDGGREDSIGRLARLISTADKVFCPLDHISHNASLYIKKHCKKYQKEIVMLKSSGVSTFSKELQKIC